MQIDLNADVGEGFGAYTLGDDDALLNVLSSANVACGFHAGDPVIMQRTIRTAAALNVDLGAHVGLPDLMGFGRRPMQVDPTELASYVVYQLGALAGLATAQGVRLSHMSFHGALGNQIAADSALADTLIAAVAAFDSQLIISSSTSTAVEHAAARYGLRVATTFLADRAYTAQGLLVPRSQPNAVISDYAHVTDRIQQFLQDGTVTCYSGEHIAINARSILLHGDTPGAVSLARHIRTEIENIGGIITPISCMAYE